MQKKWGIFRGFNPRSELTNWLSPTCCFCNSKCNLTPWVDWWLCTVGYCKNCQSLFYVSSNWEEIPGLHPRAEIERFVGHVVSELIYPELTRDQVIKICSWHENLPTSRQEIENVKSLMTIFNNGSEEAIVFTLLLWTIIFNSNVNTEEYLEEYFYFALKNPQYTQLNEKSIWLGHEVDLANSLKIRYGRKVTKAIFLVWSKNRPTKEAFRDGLRFYLPEDLCELRWFNFDFRNDSEFAREGLNITRRCSTSRFAPWTVFKSPFYGLLRKVFHKKTP